MCGVFGYSVATGEWYVGAGRQIAYRQPHEPARGEATMSQAISGRAIGGENRPEEPTELTGSASAKSNLTRLAAWISDRNIAFLIISIGMIVMLLWAGSYKMTAPGAEGIIPLVSNSPLIFWHFKLFGPYIGSDIIGSTEIIAAMLMIAGYLRPKAGIIGGLIATVMFFTTSTMLITTPGTTISIHGIRYMNLLGLFLFKDVISLGASFYLVSYFGKKAILSETHSE
jgi:reactive chlorine resistance protein C